MSRGRYRVFYKLRGDQRQVGHVWVRREGPWPDGDGIYETADQEERILIARPEKVLRNRSTGRLEKKPRVKLVVEKFELDADGRDQSTVSIVGVPEGQEVQVNVAGIRGKVRAGQGIQVRSVKAGEIAVYVDDPYIDMARRQVVLTAREVPPVGPG